MESPICSQILAGMKVTNDVPERILFAIEERIKSGNTGGYISITNTESMYHGLNDIEHFNYINEADLSLCDGVGVIAAGYFWGQKIKRYNGPILQLDCSDIGQQKGWRHFYYGGKEGVANQMAVKLREQYPQLQVVGTYSPPFGEMSKEEDQHVVDLINAAKPDIVWVGLGLLKQEAWIQNGANRASGKPAERQGKVLFINADREFFEGRAQNYLLPEHIEKIVTTFDEFRAIDGFSATIERGDVHPKQRALAMRRLVSGAAVVASRKAGRPQANGRSKKP
jgi:exopolysaccharide biosynthesis WecB/TagA/CpsF family protein